MNKSASFTLQNAVVATGDGGQVDVSGKASAAFTVSGTFVGTVTFEGSQDGVNWSSLLVTQVGTTTQGTTATAPGIFQASIAGLNWVRGRVSAYTSGAITVTCTASEASL